MIFNERFDKLFGLGCDRGMCACCWYLRKPEKVEVFESLAFDQKYVNFEVQNIEISRRTSLLNFLPIIRNVCDLSSRLSRSFPRRTAIKMLVLKWSEQKLKFKLRRVETEARVNYSGFVL